MSIPPNDPFALPPSVFAEALFDKKQYQHDAFDKSVFRDVHNAQKIVPWICRNNPKFLESLVIEEIEVCPESYLDEELRESFVDVLYRIPLKTGESVSVFILIEMKTSSERFTVFQIAKYIMRIWDTEFKQAKGTGGLATWKLPSVFPVIVHHGETVFAAPTEIAALQHSVPGLERHTLKLEAFLIDLTPMPESELPDDLELYAALRMMQGVFEKDVDVQLLEVYRKLYPQFEVTPRMLDIWKRVFRYAITSSKHFTEQKCGKTITTIKKLRGDGMSETEQPVYLYDILTAKGVAIGEMRGKAEGSKEKSREIARSLLREGLDLAFIARATGLSVEEIEKLPE